MQDSRNILLRQSTVFSRSTAAQRSAASVMLALAIAIAYFFAARLGLELQRGGVAVFWPAAGVSAGALIALGPPARWPVVAGVIIANVAANLLGDRNIWSASVFSLADAAEAVIAAAVIEYRFGSRFELDRLSHVLGIVAAAIAAAAASGVLGTVGYLLFHPSTAPILTIWRDWFASDALGIVTVAPLVIGFAAAQRHPPAPAELVEGLVALALLTGVSSIVIGQALGPWTSDVALALSFPLLLWVGARCHPVFAAAALFIASASIVLTTTFGIGVFGDTALPEPDRIHAARAGMLTIALCALVLAALFAERRRHEAALGHSEERLRLAVAASRMGMFDWDMKTGAFSWSEEWCRMLGYEVGEVEPSKAAWLARIHPDDRERAVASHDRTTRLPQEFNSDYRIVRRDGDVRWIRTHGRFLFEAGKPIRLIGLKQDVTEARHQLDTQRVLVAELQHRTRNLMAVVQSIAHQTLDSAASLEDFERRFDQRLEALSRVQSLLSRADGEPITIAALIRMELDAIGAPAFDARIVAGGPEVALRKSAVEMLALAIHELATNAIKYGALANGVGRLSVTWRDEGVPPHLVLDWVEHAIALPAHGGAPGRGYGRTLIEEALPYSLGAATRFDLGADRLHCRISLPLTDDSTEEVSA